MDARAVVEVSPLITVLYSEAPYNGHSRPHLSLMERNKQHIVRWWSHLLRIVKGQSQLLAFLDRVKVTGFSSLQNLYCGANSIAVTFGLMQHMVFEVESGKIC